jgi:SAM-dependent methyltransferase
VGCETVFLKGWREGFCDELYDYYAACFGKSKADLYDRITETRYVAMSEMLRREAPGRRLLDVGSGHGHWVDFTVREGWEARGIDLSEAAVRLCQGFNLPVTRTDFFSNELSGVGYDVVTMFELIEHVTSPRAVLERAAELLSPRGILLMSTPNFACLDRRLLGGEWTMIHAEHVSYFTPRTLGRLLREVGAFTDVRITTRNVSPTAVRHAALRQLRRVLRRRAPEAKPATVTPLYLQHGLRGRVEGSRVLRTAKAGANAILNAFDLGADMSVLCRRA